MDKRSCGSCTKCCEGYLTGEAKGKSFYPGKPCHFIAIGKGCTIYAERPINPCVTYKCGWLTNMEIPEWMKPNEVDAILDLRELEGHQYLKLTEAGSIMRAKVLSWFLQYALNIGANAVWEVEGGLNWVGTAEFNAIMGKKPPLIK